MINKVILTLLWVFNMGWFLVTDMIPTRVEALILMNLLIFTSLLVLNDAKGRKNE